MAGPHEGYVTLSSEDTPHAVRWWKQSQKTLEPVQLHFSFSMWTAAVPPINGKKTDGMALGFEIKQRDDGLPGHEAFISTRPCGFITCS